MKIKTSHDCPTSKRELIEVATRLMIEKGYTATTVDDICEGAGVTKGCFFHYFDDKEELAHQALTHFRDEQKKRLIDEAEYRKLGDPLERINGRLDAICDYACDCKKYRGCLVGTLTQELSQTYPELRNFCQGIFEAVAKDFEVDIAEAKKKYAPSADFKPSDVGRYFVSLMQGTMILVKATQNRKVVADNIEIFRDHVHRLLGVGPLVKKKG